MLHHFHSTKLSLQSLVVSRLLFFPLLSYLHFPRARMMKRARPRNAETIDISDVLFFCYLYFFTPPLFCLCAVAQVQQQSINITTERCIRRGDLSLVHRFFAYFIRSQISVMVRVVFLIFSCWFSLMPLTSSPWFYTWKLLWHYLIQWIFWKEKSH